MSMPQVRILDSQVPNKIVNVASVPQRSPFRYPGGKTWLVPWIRQWCRQLGKPATFVEPFAGGGIVSLTVAFEGLADRIVMVEKDDEVAAVWSTILNGGGEWLADRIGEFEMTPETVQDHIARPPCDLKEKAFRTILRNRVNHGGILAPGSGRIRHGEDGKGIASRWYPDTLRKRVLALAAVKDRITFVEGDGLEAMRQFAACPDAAFFIDPPYTAAGKRAGARLYTHNELDHEELFSIAGTVAGDFLMTYDNAAGVVELAASHGLATQAIPMKNTHHAEMTELLIGRDLTWARSIAESA